METIEGHMWIAEKIKTWSRLTLIVPVIRRKEQIGKREHYGLKSMNPTTQQLLEDRM